MNTALNYQPEVLVDTADLSREDWLDYRRLGIGGSDAAAIMGLSPFATIRDLYFDKIGVTPVIEEEEENWVAKEVGHRLEDLVAMIFAKKTGLEVFPVRKMFRHPLYPFMLADVDYFIRFPDGSIGILECKTCNYNAKDKWADDGIPENYVLQVRHYLAVMNMNKASMVDMHLAYEFFYKIKAGARVLLVGDVHQLPSVGAGDVFRQLILCGKIPVTVLNLVYRQGKDSNIPINAQLINEGKTNLQWGDDFQMVECSGADAAAQIVKNIYLKEIQMYGMEQVQILSPYKVRSAAGVLELNRSLQDEVNPPVSGKRELHLGGEMFREGDRILQNKNTEFASNGDLGTLVQIAEDEDNNPLVQIVFTDGRRVKYEAEQVEMIEHANAITIHKSQGSECQVVIIPWLKAFYPMLKRNIFYTGITRAKQRVYIVGEWKAVCQAIHTDDTGTRKTMLAVKIQQYCERYQRQENRRIPATICNRAV